MHFEHRASLTEAEAKRLFHWREHVFAPVGRHIEWEPLAHHYVCVEEGRLAAHLSCDIKRLRHGGRTISILAIGSVVVHPEFQGRKLGVRLLEYVHGLLGSVFDAAGAWLFCDEGLVPYYARAGYRRVPNPVTFQQSSGLVACPWVSMIFEKKGPLIGDGEVVIDSRPW